MEMIQVNERQDSTSRRRCDVTNVPIGNSCFYFYCDIHYFIQNKASENQLLHRKKILIL